MLLSATLASEHDQAHLKPFLRSFSHVRFFCSPDPDRSHPDTPRSISIPSHNAATRELLGLLALSRFPSICRDILPKGFDIVRFMEVIKYVDSPVFSSCAELVVVRNAQLLRPKVWLLLLCRLSNQAAINPFRRLGKRHTVSSVVVAKDVFQLVKPSTHA
jgi:hypothetical protein